jgi:hypothetical protein
MAFARDVYTASASQTDFTISFAYIDAVHVEVYKDGVLQTSGAGNDYTIVSTTIVRFNSGLTGGETVVLQRATSQTTRLVDYATASTLTEEDLDNDSLQAFYMSQESIDIANQAMGKTTAEEWDFENTKSDNVPTPTAGDQVANKAYVDAQMAAAGNVPTPDNPGDDGQFLVASAGTFAWATAAAWFVAFSQDATVAAARTELGLGTAAVANTGVASGNVPAMDATGYPAADGSRITLAAIPGFIDGLVMSNDTDTDHDILFGVGVCTNGDEDEMLQNSTAMTKQIDATWAAGDDAGGLSSSLTAPANDTWYHCFIGKVGGTVDFGFDTSVTGANLATDHSFTDLRRIGSVLTDGSANILPFTQTGDYFEWVTREVSIDQSGSSFGTSAVLGTLDTPLGLKVKANIVAMAYDEASAALLVSSPDQTDETPSHALTSAQYGDVVLRAGVTTEGTAEMERITDTSSRIRYRSTNTGAHTMFKIVTLGWTDPRGRTWA